MAIKNYLWDSCVFIAYLNNENHAYDVASIGQFLTETKQRNGCKIFTSSIALAEVTPTRLTNGQYGQFTEFLDDFSGAITIIDADPIICAKAGELKDLSYKKGAENRRVLTTGDAIMLATALELEETYGVKLDALHTFDNGRGKGNPEGKGIPLLSYEQWCDGIDDNELAKKIISLNRCKPIHTSPGFDV